MSPANTHVRFNRRTLKELQIKGSRLRSTQGFAMEAEVEVKLESQPTTAQPALMVEGELTLQTYRVAPIFVSLLV